MTALYLFASTFALVFALGFQSQNVNGGHYTHAFVTSFVIGGTNLVLYKMVPNADVGEMGAYLLGGPFGIVASMWAHERFVRPKRHRLESTPGIDGPRPVRRVVALSDPAPRHPHPYPPARNPRHPQ